MILHIVPTVTRDFTRDYVMLIPGDDESTVFDAFYDMECDRVAPAVIERDVAFAGLTAFRRMYDDIIVHTRPI